MRTYNGEWEGLALGLGFGLGFRVRRVVRMEEEGLCRGIRGVGGVGGVGGREQNNRMNQTTLPYVNL